MAAHVLTFLKDISTSPYNSLDSIQFALGHCQAGDQMDYNDWDKLYYAPDLKNVREIATGLLPKYEKIWSFLNKPATAEAWSAQFMDLKKHHKRKAYINLLFAKVQP
jgi:hypothetical protein